MSLHVFTSCFPTYSSRIKKNFLTSFDLQIFFLLLIRQKILIISLLSLPSPPNREKAPFLKSKMLGVVLAPS